MKKIVGILAVAAVATSLFAADVSAKVKLYGDLFNYDGVSEQAKAIQLQSHKSHNWEPDFAFSVSSDEAGAQIALKTQNEWGSGDGETTTNWKIWFKPLDVLTVKLGAIGESMNTEMIDWSNRVLNYDDYGYELVYSQDAITVALSLVSTRDGFLFKDAKTVKNEKIAAAEKKASDDKIAAAKKAGYKDDYSKDGELSDAEKKAIKEAVEKESVDAYVGEINLFGQYAADFGTIKAMYDAKNTFKNNVIAVGYNNNFDGLNMFADVALTIDENKKLKAGDTEAKKVIDLGVKVDAYAAYTVDALTLRGYVRYGIGQLTNVNKDYGCYDEDGKEATVFTLPGNQNLMLIARVDYKLDAVNVFAYFKAEDLLKKAKKEGDTKSSNVLVSTIRAGLNGSVGICAWEGYLQLDTGKGTKYDKVNVSVPVNFTVNF